VTFGGKRVLVKEEAKAPLRLQRVLDTLGEMFIRRA
jgi:hypothetical protein